MDLLRTLWLRLRSLAGSPSLNDELHDELRFHVEMQAVEYVREGMPAAEARRRALREFGGVDRMAEECRDTHAGARLHAIVRTVRLALRRLVREPSFVLPATATLALGTGALVAIFTLADAVLLRPLPYPDAHRIVELRHTLPGWGIPASGQSGGTFAHYLANASSFESMGAWFDRELSITEEENPERVRAALVTPGVLRSLGVQPVLGRAFTDEDGGGDAVLLSHEFWQSRYAADPAVVGRTVRVNSVEREIIGVLPAGTDFPRRGTQMLFGMGPGTNAEEGDLHNLYMEAIGRLHPGVTVAEAEAELARLVASLPARYGDVTAAQLAESRIAPRVTPLLEGITGEVRPALVLLLCTSVFVLLIAVANVANLVLARAEHQRREIAVERALGAGSAAVIGRFAAEYALLALVGTGAGLLLAHAAVRARFGFSAWHLPRLQDASVTGRAIVLALLAAAGIAALLALLAWLRTARVDVQAALKGSLQRATASRESRAAQRLLSTVQVALACALIIASAVMVQSVARLARVPLGFNPANVLAFDIALPVRQYRGYTAQAAFHDDLAERLRAIPGVSAVGAITLLPLTPMPNWADAAVIAPEMAQPDVPPLMSMRGVTPGYFAAMGIPLLRGRTFDPNDLRADGAGVILSATLARTLFGDIDVVGRRIVLPHERTVPLSVIGVAGDVRDASLAAPAAPLVYLPSLGAAQLQDGRADIPVWPGEMTFVVRSALPHSTLLPGVRAALKELDPTLPLAYPRTLDELVAAGSARPRMTAWLLLGAAAGALLLGIVGIYGVISYGVTRRAPELALRMALGATPWTVRLMVLRQAAVIGIAGVAGGIAAALALTQLLAGLLFQVSPRDPATFAAAAAGVLLLAVAASSLPARRAARTDPNSALSAQ